jgi:hypothetical protein
MKTTSYVFRVFVTSLALAITLHSFTLTARANEKSGKARARFDPAKIGKPVVKRLAKAWHDAALGTTTVEAALSIHENFDGSYGAINHKPINGYRQITFHWNPETIALVHTHPTDADPKPSGHDRHLANRLGVPIMTITLHGMYMYDPQTKRVTKIMNGLDWLNPDKWDQLN